MLKYEEICFHKEMSTEKKNNSQTKNSFQVSCF